MRNSTSADDVSVYLEGKEEIEKLIETTCIYENGIRAEIYFTHRKNLLLEHRKLNINIVNIPCAYGTRIH
jgi:hypothetical protein